MNVKVGVIIPCYNYGEYVEDAVDSVLGSTFENIEIIIVDDGSNDPNTIAALQRMATKPKTRVIRRENGGLSAARNTGIQATHADYILLLDADDRIAPTFIEKGVWLLEKNKNFAYVYPLVQLFGDRNEIWHTLPFNFFYLKFRNYIPATIIIRRSAWELGGGYDETMRDGYEDWEFLLSLGKRGLYGIHINEILFYYRKHHGSMLGDSNRKRANLINQIHERHPDLYKWKRVEFLRFGCFEVIRRVKSKLSETRARIVRNINTKVKEKIKKSISNVGYLNKSRLNGNLKYARLLPLRITEGKKRILIVLPWLQVGGVERVFLHIVKALSCKYDFIMVTTLNSVAQPWQSKFHPYTKAIYHTGGFLPKQEDKLHFFLNLLESWKIDIIHLSNSQLGYELLPYIKKQYPRVKVLDTLHMEEPWAAWDYFRVSQEYKKYIDKRVTLTHSQQTRLIEMGESEDKVKIIPNGIELYDALAHQIDVGNPKQFTVSFIGRLVDQKQPVLFLKTAKECMSRNLPINFEIHGDGDLKKRLFQLKKIWKVDNVTIYPFTDDVYGVLENTSVLCVPSLREGLPMIGLEAMSAEVPVVATRVAGWVDLIEDGKTGILCEPTPESLADACEKLYKDTQLYRQIASQAKEVLKDCYTVSTMANAYATIYEQF